MQRAERCVAVIDIDVSNMKCIVSRKCNRYAQSHSQLRYQRAHRPLDTSDHAVSARFIFLNHYPQPSVFNAMGG